MGALAAGQDEHAYHAELAAQLHVARAQRGAVVMHDATSPVLALWSFVALHDRRKADRYMDGWLGEWADLLREGPGTAFVHTRAHRGIVPNEYADVRAGRARAEQARVLVAGTRRHIGVALHGVDGKEKLSVRVRRQAEGVVSGWLRGFSKETLRAVPGDLVPRAGRITGAEALALQLLQSRRWFVADTRFRQQEAVEVLRGERCACGVGGQVGWFHSLLECEADEVRDRRRAIEWALRDGYADVAGDGGGRQWQEAEWRMRRGMGEELGSAVVYEGRRRVLIVKGGCERDSEGAIELLRVVTGIVGDATPSRRACERVEALVRCTVLWAEAARRHGELAWTEARAVVETRRVCCRAFAGWAEEVARGGAVRRAALAQLRERARVGAGTGLAEAERLRDAPGPGREAAEAEWRACLQLLRARRDVLAAGGHRAEVRGRLSRALERCRTSARPAAAPTAGAARRVDGGPTLDEWLRGEEGSAGGERRTTGGGRARGPDADRGRRAERTEVPRRGRPRLKGRLRRGARRAEEEARRAELDRQHSQWRVREREEWLAAWAAKEYAPLSPVRWRVPVAEEEVELGTYGVPLFQGTRRSRWLVRRARALFAKAHTLPRQACC